ncbi:MAG TPA: heme-binding protein [Rhizomicrobium sp.]
MATEAYVGGDGETERSRATRVKATNGEKPAASSFPVDHQTLVRALKASVKPAGGPSNGGLDNHMWAAVVDRQGVVQAVCYSGNEVGDQWPGSRAIAIEKANTANALSLPTFAFSTANLYTGAQPGGFMFGIATTNPVDTATMYAGDPSSYGTQGDPMVGQKASGVVTFGGGLALYNDSGIVGAVGVSGDTSCGDHNVAWRVRKALGLDRTPGGISAANNDAIIYDIGMMGKSSSGYGHPKSGLKEDEVAEEIGASSEGK